MSVTRPERDVQDMLQVLTPLTNHVAAVAPAALIGVACGLLAIAFTIINLKVARARDALLQVHPSPACAACTPLLTHACCEPAC